MTDGPVLHAGSAVRSRRLPAMANAPLGPGRMLLYGLPNIPVSVVGLPLALYLPRF